MHILGHSVISACTVVVALSLTLSNALARSGPGLPCLNCPEWSGLNDWRSLPEAGIWRNPDQSGTGFMLEVQGDRLAGYYYLYDEAGNPLWYAFNGILEPSDQADIAWTLEAELDRFENGACLNCPYQPPELGESPGMIRLEFRHRGYGRFRVGEDAYQNILPLTYGISGSRIFQPYADYVMPEIGSTLDSHSWPWMLIFGIPGNDIFSGFDIRLVSIPAESTPSHLARRYRVRRFVGYPGDADQINSLGYLDCEAADGYGPICRLDFNGTHIAGSPLEGRTFWIRPGDITDSRFFGEDEDGWTVEAFRIGHD